MTLTIDRNSFSEAARKQSSDRRDAYVRELAEARDNLREAEQGFRTAIRSTVPGACSDRGEQEIDADLDELVARGRAIGRVAKALEQSGKRARTYDSAMPAKLTATLMGQSFDHLLAAHASLVVTTAAELEACEP